MGGLQTETDKLGGLKTGNYETGNNIWWGGHKTKTGNLGEGGLKIKTGNSETGNNIWGGLKSETGKFLLHFQNSKLSNRCQSIYSTDIKRQKRDTGIQYRHEKKEDTTGFILKPIARPKYGTVYQHQGMLLQNLHRRYLYIVIRLPNLKDLDQKIPSFPNCNNYGIHRASNPNPLNDDTKTNDNELHQQLCVTFKIDYLQEMDIITKVKDRLECKINVTLLALLPNKIV